MVLGLVLRCVAMSASRLSLVLPVNINWGGAGGTGFWVMIYAAIIDESHPVYDRSP
jgi:hypothetical protein